MLFKFHFQMGKHKMNLILSISALILLSLISIATFTNTAFAENDDKIVIMHTNSGPLIIELFPDDAPNTVENFLKLTESGFYDNLIFHRIIKGFMIQGGDPLSKYGEDGFTNIGRWGTGDAGYEIPAEFNTIKHNRGIISMARGADIDSASSQFFIVHKNSNFLDGQYTAFGKLLTEESYDTLDKIANLQTTPKDLPNDLHASQIIKAGVITRADIENPPSPEELERLDESDSKPTISGLYVNTEYDFSLLPPKGWTILYAEPDSGPNDPVITFLGQKKKLPQGLDEYAPYIYVNVNKLGDKTFQEMLDSRLAQYHKMDQQKAIQIDSERMTTIKNEQGKSYGAYLLTAKQMGVVPPVSFAQAIISHTDFIYGITYANHEQHFETDMIFFDNLIKSFATATQDSEPDISGLLEEVGIKTTEQETTESQGGGCLIATAAFGSEMAPQVQFLRELRDNTVLQTESGTSFMTGFNQFYYSFSPVIADYERENPAFKETVKLALTPLLTSLTLLQYADIDSESEMLGYGIGVILLNIGMYFVAPAVLIMKVRSLHKLQ